jgi:hypothetical protein
MKRSLFALAFVLVACGDSTPPPAPPPQTDPALVAWSTVAEVLAHPRCKNCHPGGDAPLQGDDGRAHAMNVRRGKEGRGNVGEECTTCHGPANPPSAYGAHVPPGSEKAWHMPSEDMKLVFDGVPSAALCAQIKDPARNGGKDMTALRAHLDDPLVTWGWSPGFGRTPVPIPRDRFLAAFDTWSRAGAPCPR